MKRFAFRLETPLKLRRRQVDRASQALARARHDVLSVRRELDRVEKERAHWAQTNFINDSGDIDLPRDQRRVEYLDHLDAIALDLKNDMGQLASKVSACETALRAAVRDRQILERLKEIRRLSYMESIRALETKRSDFAASVIFRRNAP